jgi:hypothetical protein
MIWHARVRWNTRRRFDPSSSPSATSPSAPITPPNEWTDNFQLKWDFRELRLYLRSPRHIDVVSETAFFCEASYFVISVWFKGVLGESNNFRDKFPEF